MKELKDEQRGKMAEKQTEIESMTADINILREARKESESKLSTVATSGESQLQSNDGHASSELNKHDTDRRKVVRTAKDRMLEGYVPSAVFFAK